MSRNDYDKDIPFLEFLYERWRMLVTTDKIQCTYAHNEEGDTAVFLTNGHGSPMARLLMPDDMHDWEPSFAKSEELNRAFTEAAEDDWRRSFDDFLEDSEPALRRLKKYASDIRNQAAKERKEREEDE